MTQPVTNFACYRLPEQTSYTFVAQTSGRPDTMADINALNGVSGFVLAPFQATAACPICLLRPDVIEVHEVGEGSEVDRTGGPLAELPEEKAAYAAAFGRFHEEIVKGRFSKLVLSRSSRMPRRAMDDAQQLFLRACRCYPHQYVALVAVDGAGVWLMATPEVLLERQDDRWRTMALAGTMKNESGPVVWSDKNRAEQQMVSRYIEDVLTPLTEDIDRRGPYTAQAAHLLHLRTDFCFRLHRDTRVGTLLRALHPTPAVCGVPKEAAQRFIIETEPHDRRYYSGFCGPLSIREQTHLYVSLRCMEIGRDELVLYAGGGILPESTMEMEWKETQSKLQTMSRLIGF